MNSSISIVMRSIDDLTPYEDNPRNNDNAVDAVAESIKEFGFKNPVIIDKDGTIVAGHTRYKAAKQLGITEIPCVSADDLSEEQIRAFRIAKDLGLNYFLMLDDDYKEIDYRYEENGMLKAKPARQMDRLFEDMINFLEVSGALTVAFCQGGDFVGGVDGGNFKKGLLRKAMNSLFCRTDRPFEFRGTMNEDVTTYTTLSSRGNLFFSLCAMCVIQIPTQSLAGGMTDAYRESGTYLKTMYSVMSMPSSIKISMMYTTHRRIHHRINWEHCAPKILNEKYRKAGAGEDGEHNRG